MGRDSSISPATPGTAACTRAPSPPRAAAPRWPVLARFPLAGPWSLACRWPRSLSPRRSARQDTLPPPQVQRRLGSPREAADPQPPPAVPGAEEPPRAPRPFRGSGKATRRRPPGRGRGESALAAPRSPGAPLTFGRELAGGPQPSCPGGNPAWRQKSCSRRTRRSEGGRGAAVRASERPRAARRTGTGARGLPAAAARAGTCHILSPPALRQPPQHQRRGHGLRSARCGEWGRSSAPARRRLTPAGPPGGGTGPWQAAAAAELTRFKNSPACPGSPSIQTRSPRWLCPVPLSSPFPQRLARGRRTAGRRFRAAAWPKPRALPGQNQTPKATRHGLIPSVCSMLSVWYACRCMN